MFTSNKILLHLELLQYIETRIKKLQPTCYWWSLWGVWRRGLGGGGGASKLSSVKNQSVRLVHRELMATPRLHPSTTPGHSTTQNSSCSRKCNFLLTLQCNHLQVLYCGTLLSYSTVLWLRSVFVLGSAVLTIILYGTFYVAKPTQFRDKPYFVIRNCEDRQLSSGVLHLVM